MNPDSPQTPREALEARLTAMLLGELPADEAVALREIILRDPQLAALEQQLRLSGAVILTSTAATAVAPEGTGYRVEFRPGRPLLADAVVIATPAFAARHILARLDPALAAELEQIRYTSTAIVRSIAE